MPISKRLELLEYIKSVNGIILEDDYDSELRYNTQPIPALQGLDKDGRVIYLGTFSKALSPAIRVGFILLPDWLISKYKKHFDSHFCHVSIDTQKTLTAFIKEGYLQKHIRKLRNLNRQKHNLMLEELKEFKDYKVLAKNGGLAIIIAPTKPFNWQKLQFDCEKNGIKIYLMKEKSGGNIEALRLGFGGLSLDEIPKAINEVKNIWNQCFF